MTNKINNLEISMNEAREAIELIEQGNSYNRVCKAICQRYPSVDTEDLKEAIHTARPDWGGPIPESQIQDLTEQFKEGTHHSGTGQYHDNFRLLMIRTVLAHSETCRVSLFRVAENLCMRLRDEGIEVPHHVTVLSWIGNWRENAESFNNPTTPTVAGPPLEIDERIDWKALYKAIGEHLEEAVARDPFRTIYLLMELLKLGLLEPKDH